MKKILLVFFIALLGLSLSTKASFALSLEPYFGPVEIKISNLEIVNYSGKLADGVEDNWGIFKVTSIERGFDTLWYAGKNGEYLSGIFYNLDIAGITPIDTNGDTVIDSTRVDMANTKITGMLDLYLDDSDLPGFTALVDGGPSARTGTTTYPTFTDSNVYGGKALSIAVVPGILPGVTISNIIDGLTIIGSGKGNGYGAIVPGSGPLAAMFDNDGYLGGNADLYMSFNYTYPASNGWTIISHDPIRTSIVPEPTSMLLFGIGTFGLAVLRRRKVA